MPITIKGMEHKMSPVARLIKYFETGWSCAAGTIMKLFTYFQISTGGRPVAIVKDSSILREWTLGYEYPKWFNSIMSI